MTPSPRAFAADASRESRIWQRYVDEEWLARHVEDVLEPDLPIIDPHHHVWWQRPVPYRLEDLVGDLRSGHDVRATVYMESAAMYRVDGPEHLRAVGETEYANGLAAVGASGAFGSVRPCAGIVGACDLTVGDKSEEVLCAHIAAGNGRFRGVRINPYIDFIASGQPPRRGLLAGSEFRRGFSRLSRLGLVVDAMCLHTQLTELAHLARTFPDTTIVVNHVGGPARIGPFANRVDDVTSVWSVGMQELAACPNVSVKLGGLANPFFCDITFRSQPSPPSSVELAAALRPWMEPTISWFGPDRCMFESNFPADKFTSSYVVLWNAFKRLAAGYSPEERGALFSGTAARVYRL